MNFNFPHLYLEETESTNIVALDLLSKTNPPNGFLVITDYQTAGKGQYGRNWHSERGKNLLFSLIMGPLNLGVNEIFRLHIASSLAMVRTLKKWNLDCSIKWPNDIYVCSKKLAGILIQNQLKGSVVEWSVIGIGINVNQSEFPIKINATSMQLETGIEIIREDLILSLTSYILHLTSHLLLLSSDISPLTSYNLNDALLWNELLNEYNSNLYLKNQVVSFMTNDSNNFLGKINCVTKEGKLRVEKTEGGFFEFGFGEIRYEIGTMN